MANQLLTISMITQESLRVLTASLKFITNVRQDWDNEFAIKGAKIGQTLNIRKPARYQGRTGPVVNIEAQTETYVPLTLDQQYGVDLSFTSAEQRMSLDMYSDRIIKPAMANVANRMDAYGLTYANKLTNSVGTPGTSLASLTNQQRIDLVLAAGVKLDQNLAPRDGSWIFLAGPASQAGFVGAGIPLFNPAPVISEQYKSGQVTEALGFGWYMDQNMPRQEGATYTAAPTVAGANQTGSTLNVTVAAATTLPVGTTFTLPGVNAVNPQTKADLATLQQFTVTSRVDNATGAVALQISPAIVTTGAFQNVTASPTTGNSLSMAGATGVSYDQSIAYHPDAFCFGCADLDTPGGTDRAFMATDPQTGLSVRVIRDYNVISDQWITRFDVLFGFNTLYEQLGTRVIVS